MASLKARQLDIFVEQGIEKQPRFLRYDFNALADFEQVNGMGLGQLLSMKAVFGTARAMLWAGCKGDDPTFTLEKAGNLIGEYIKKEGTVDDVLGKCFEAAIDQGAIGSKKKDDEEESELGNVLQLTAKESDEDTKPGKSSSKKPNR